MTPWPKNPMTLDRKTSCGLFQVSPDGPAAGCRTGAFGRSSAGSTTTFTQGTTASSGGAWARSAASPTPSPGDTTSTGPANPGTGESAQNESTRLDYTPWLIGAVALLTLIVILVWRRRRNTTIV
jgi:cobalamin biosynthesis Mg chelatase CobN